MSGLGGHYKGFESYGKPLKVLRSDNLCFNSATLAAVLKTH